MRCRSQSRSRATLALTQAAAALPTSAAPVFAGIPGGMGLLPLALAGSGRFRVETGAVVRELAPIPGGRAQSRPASAELSP